MLVKMEKLETNKRKYMRSARDLIDQLERQMNKLNNLLEGESILIDIQILEKSVKKRYEDMTR